ncbi:hypothetical protein UFOVP658_58 [uncultured Caudovirales phage]|uniref:Uncharacterized protein n=1 Tax=uncultured Caudovirales phage TaxID=2100421 RepID=A0A6J5NHJ6_9CAUD|nr:hypothetical protein UFOVP658_58 [uncultured Caudovirales phage]
MTTEQQNEITEDDFSSLESDAKLLNGVEALINSLHRRKKAEYGLSPEEWKWLGTLERLQEYIATHIEETYE